MSVHDESLRHRLEQAEVEYANNTGGDALVTAEDRGTTRWQLSDGSQAQSLEEAVKGAEALVRFTRNQRNQ